MLLDGDEVFTSTIYWVFISKLWNYLRSTHRSTHSIDTDFKITPAQLEAAITPKQNMDYQPLQDLFRENLQLLQPY
jgi:aspartate aminotransferase